MRLSFDSNLLVYAAQGSDPKNAAAVAVLDRASRGDCVQTLQSLGECFNVLTRKRSFTVEEAALAIGKFRAIFPVVAADESAFDAAMMAVRDHRLQFWDALLWATARRAGCRILLTEDMNDGQDIGGVKIVNPLNAANRPLLDVILPLAEF